MLAPTNFIQELKQQLQKPLPGEEAQYRMAPSYRPKLSPQEIAAFNPRLGGVLLLLYPVNQTWHIAFTKRKEYAGVHSGQMSFPGGKKDEMDTNIIQTALRETEEEIGVNAGKIEVMGSLSQLYIPPSNFLVHPTVGYCINPYPFQPQATEVEQIIEIPVSFFLSKEGIDPQREIKLFNGHTVRAPAYVYNEHVIWGATAIILSEFTYLVEQLNSTQRI